MPDPNLSAAENLLSLLRPDRNFSPFEAKLLLTALLLHMEHGAANFKFISMMGDFREHVNDWYDRDEGTAYIQKIVNKEAFDRTGLICGMGHAVYTLSDPREVILKEYVKQLVREKGTFDADFALHENIEAVAPEIIAKARNMPRPPAPNVDFYSGAVYYMLGVPPSFYTAIFAIARIVGWSAHRLEVFVPLTRALWLSLQNERFYQATGADVFGVGRAGNFFSRAEHSDTLHARRNYRGLRRQNFYRPCYKRAVTRLRT